MNATAPSKQVSLTSGTPASDWSPHPTNDEVQQEYETDLATALELADGAGLAICPNDRFGLQGNS